jgi:hypothetical protein
MYFCIAILFYLILFSVTSSISTYDDLISDTYIDDCRYIFLDIGANIGMHSRFLFEQNKYPNNGYSKNMFNIYFPNVLNRSDICVIGFEANPLHRKRLDQIEAYYSKMNYKVKYFTIGAGDEDNTNLLFHYKNEYDDEKHHNWYLNIFFFFFF